MIHGRLLQYFLNLGGVIITKINKVIRYKQSDFLYKYVKEEIHKRVLSSQVFGLCFPMTINAIQSCFEAEIPNIL